MTRIWTTSRAHALWVSAALAACGELQIGELDTHESGGHGNAGGDTFGGRDAGLGAASSGGTSSGGDGGAPGGPELGGAGGGAAGASAGASGSSGAAQAGASAGGAGSPGGAAGLGGAAGVDPPSGSPGGAGGGGAGEAGSAGAGQAGATSYPARPKPETLVRWEPYCAGKVTAIVKTPTTDWYTYVGCADGSLFMGIGLDVRPDWNVLHRPLNPNIPPMPSLPVTSIHVTSASPPLISVAFGGAGDAPRIWSTGRDAFSEHAASPTSPVWSVSRNLLATGELIAETAAGTYVSKDDGQSWDSAARATHAGLSLGDDEWITCIREIEVGTDQAYWVGTNLGRVFFTNAPDAAAPSWALRHDPGMPARPVVGITLDRWAPDDVWITFAGVHADAIWHSTDQGLSWRLRTAGLPAWSLEPDQGSFSAVSRHPRYSAFYVSVFTVEGAEPSNVATSFWMMDDDVWTEN